MRNLRQIALAAGLFTLALAGALAPLSNQTAKAFHSQAEIDMFRQMLSMPPVDSSILFPTASTCKGCHGYDANGYALVDFFGNDVNIHDDWSATLMANAAKDPFWRAKVSHEILLNPGHSTAIQTKCTSCHAPMGHYTAFFRGHDSYTLADLLQDTIGLDGVSCAGCHMIGPDQLGQLHSGNLSYDTSRLMFGPFPGPFAAPMTDFLGFRPVYGPHISQAGVCASCHTLITEPIGLDGELVGTTFVEQATYHEWLNSLYAEDQENITCQQCHMPELEESVVISSNYLFLPGRSQYSRHEFAGANAFMLRLMKEYRQELDIKAREADFDETLAATLRMLQQESLDAQLQWAGVEADTAIFSLRLLNRAGHKFPSGYPSRRLFVSFLVTTPGGDTLFHSGAMNDRYELIDEDLPFEPHHHIIRRPGQVQIYEMVAGDEVNPFTVVLEHASVMNKDNRLPPRGFRSNHAVYDTTRIVGQALSDPDFNRDGGQEGSGADILYFHVGTAGYAGPVLVKAQVYYHSLPPRWVNPIFESSTPEIESFRQQFLSIDNAPVLVAEQNLSDVSFPVVTALGRVSPAAVQVRVFPNPVGEEIHFRLSGPAALPPALIELHDMSGKKVLQAAPVWSLQQGHWQASLPATGLPAGVYSWLLRDRRGKLLGSGKLVR